MAKIVITIVDMEDNKGDLDIKFQSNVPMPEDYSQYTTAQILAGQLYEVCNKLLEGD